MSIFLSLWNNWTIYEKSTTSIFIFLVFVLIGVGTKYLTKSTSLTLVAMLSLILSGIITLLSLWFIKEVLNVTVSSTYLLIPTVVLIVNTLNLSTFITYYIQEKDSKNFDLTELKREHIYDTVNISVFLGLFISAFSIFLKNDLFNISLIIGIVSISMLWINYYILYRLVK
jgi:hypothetical protein